MIKKILLGIDRSEYTQRNIEFACDLAKKLNAELSILHVVVFPQMAAPMIPYDPQLLINDAEKFLNNIKDNVEGRGVKATIHVESTYGSVAHKVLDYAKKENPDLIALGAMGASEIKDLFLGSVAHTVSRHVKCPVLIIR